ncbi:MarR family transcriptional regulator [Sporosarcina sp. Sa2YVA2]|uniref:MarR family transcriptional regulator n=1 Tax=Sporosarcina quadrami TaxID=2762234 RepID=A0ABR8U5G4_9BACL|nr:MarR family transcriptional regulator [Sporosarcina quadrami]MBD7983287.1 MarR family transcriptional regulator [Sporosarcina quadrami]
MSQKTIFELLHTIEQVTHKMLVRWRQASTIDLGISHILVLHELSVHGESRPSDLAKNLNFTPASLTHLSTKLTKQKLISRRQDETDRRTSYWSLTEIGLEVLTEAQENGHIVRKDLFSHLSEEEQTTLLAIYTKLNQTLK